MCNGERGQSPIVKEGIGLGDWPEKIRVKVAR